MAVQWHYRELGGTLSLAAASVADLLCCSISRAQEFGAKQSTAKSQAEAALGEEPPPPIEPFLGPADWAFLEVLHQNRLHDYYKPNEVDTRHVKRILTMSWCQTPTIAIADAQPELEAMLDTTRFIPVDKGIAVVLLSGKVKSLGGEPTITRRSNILPVAVQLDSKRNSLTSCIGIIRGGQSWIAPIQLHQEVQTILVTFVRTDHSPVATTWTGEKTVLDGRFGGIAIDRKELVTQHAKAVAEEAKRIAESNSRGEAQRIAAMDLREWNSKDSSQQWHAEFVSYEKGVVTLQTADLEKIEVKLRDLSKEGQRFVQKAVKAQRDAEKAAAAKKP